MSHVEADAAKRGPFVTVKVRLELLVVSTCLACLACLVQTPAKIAAAVEPSRAICNVHSALQMTGIVADPLVFSDVLRKQHAGDDLTKPILATSSLTGFPFTF